MKYRKYPPDTVDRWVLIVCLVLILILLLAIVHYR